MHAAIALAESEETRPPLPARRSPDKDKLRLGSSRMHMERSPRKLSRVKPESGNVARSGHNLLQYFAGIATTHTRSRVRASTRRTIRHIREEPLRASGRLGKYELGPYAFEDAMPNEVRRDLMAGSEPLFVNQIGRDGKVLRQKVFPNQTAGIIPVLADLCARQCNTTAAYLCHPSTQHIYKVRCNGNFCGYWNIQVLLSWLQAVTPEGPQEIPNVLQIQAYIHQAWDRGLCPHGEIETGGIRNTRKWIGTLEALAFFTRIGVKVEALAFGGKDDRANYAVADLLDHVEAYFMSGTEDAEKHGTSFVTNLPPIYFQRLGHSLTIIGLERLVDGSRNLLMFDSSFATSSSMKSLTAQRQAHTSPESLLRPYRKSDLSLTRWKEFEIIVPRASIANGSAGGK
ncbi:uncharacterized protein RCC_07594 [Ramularia collo-cygni]|uniref:UFSP1/2/DUB catalytic domain-containing protein n=1 Tax=Ramularia collo-cygni TaxID=112498 RepID=A0A2D3VIA5_9PEZI|nr:uncharacterized protein RCC_07594 [Ramularia collo-cygni]CZT21729.1 uncharacterized protein RCC_07594 [Ramularia collo-cygni]